MGDTQIFFSTGFGLCKPTLRLTHCHWTMGSSEPNGLKHWMCFGGIWHETWWDLKCWEEDMQFFQVVFYHLKHLKTRWRLRLTRSLTTLDIKPSPHLLSNKSLHKLFGSNFIILNIQKNMSRNRWQIPSTMMGNLWLTGTTGTQLVVKEPWSNGPFIQDSEGHHHEVLSSAVMGPEFLVISHHFCNAVSPLLSFKSCFFSGSMPIVQKYAAIGHFSRFVGEQHTVSLVLISFDLHFFCLSPNLYTFR